MTADVEAAHRDVQRILRSAPLKAEDNYATGAFWRKLILLHGDHVAASNVIADVLVRARQGEPWARKIVDGAIADLSASGNPVPEPFATYIRDKRDGKLPPNKRGSPREALAFRNISFRLAVFAATHHGLPRTRNKKKRLPAEAPPSACSLVKKVLAELGYHNITEWRLERLTDDFSSEP